MSTPITLEDIYQIFQRSQEEADRRFAEADRRAAEHDRWITEMRAENDRRAAENAQRIAENDRRAVEHDQWIAEMRAENDRRAAENDRRAAENDQRIAEMRAENDRRAAETDRIIKELRNTANSLTSRWGRFVENLVAPAALRLFQEKGFAVQEVYQRVRSARGNRNLEIDILVVDDDVAIVIEVKSRLTQNEIRQVLNTLTEFKSAFPHYKNYQIYGAVAAIEIDKDVDTYAYNQGLFVIKQSGDSVKISNEESFNARIW